MAAFFLALSGLLYGNSLFGEFVYDDSQFTIQAEMRQPEYLLQTWFRPSLPAMEQFPHYRPLTYFSFSLNYLIFGQSPFWFHLVNVLINGLVCWLLFVVSRRLFRNDLLAFVTAIFFAILPVHTEAIAYIKARDELLVALFGMLAWLAFLRATEQTNIRTKWSFLSGVFVFAAFLSKESALVLPGVFGGALLLLHGWKATIRAWPVFVFQILAIALYFFLHALAVGPTTIPQSEFLYFGQNPLGYVPWHYVPWTAFELLFVAFAITFVPWNLSATYGFSHLPLVGSPFGYWMAPAGMAVLLVLLLCIALPKFRTTPLGIGSLVFLVLYFPFSKIPFYKGIDFFAERWLYAPSIGLAMIGGFLLWKIWKHMRSFAPVIFTAIVVGYLFVLIPRNLVWQNDTTLGESLVQDAPNSVISYVYLGNNRLQYGRLQEATALVSTGLGITRDHIPLHHVAAAVAMAAGNLHVAEQAVGAAEELGGGELANVIIRSTLLAKQHLYQESLDHLMASKWFNPDEHRVRMLLALNLWMLDRHDEAREYFDWDAHLPVIHMSDEEKIFMFETY